MGSQSTYRKVQRTEASQKLLALRDRTLRLIDDLAGCPDANGIVDFELLRQAAGMMQDYTTKIYK
jgi:hypothetical protein